MFVCTLEIYEGVTQSSTWYRNIVAMILLSHRCAIVFNSCSVNVYAYVCMYVCMYVCTLETYEGVTQSSTWYRNIITMILLSHRFAIVFNLCSVNVYVYVCMYVHWKPTKVWLLMPSS